MSETYPSKAEEWIRAGRPNTPAEAELYALKLSQPLTQLQKLGLRLAQFPGRMVSAKIVVNEQGEPVLWVVTDGGKAEGLTLKANGS